MKRFVHLLAILLLMLPSSIAYASHIVGGDIEYESIGPRIWKIKLTIYRDCAGAPLCSNMGCTQSMIAKPNITLNPIGCSATPNQQPVTLSLKKVEDISKPAVELCGGSAKNGCTNLGQVSAGTYNPSVEKYIFEGTLDLSAPSLNNSTCRYWDVYWTLCCRNINIWNLVNSGEQDYRIGATIDIFNRSVNPLKNNSPIIKNEPVIVVCANQEIVYNLGGTDPDGDFLTYEIAPSKQSNDSSVVYNAPGSATYPFPLSATKVPHINYPQPNGPYVIIDSITGTIRFNGLNNTPSYITGNLNVRIKQWTNDANGTPVMVGITQRDVQMLLVNCPPNNAPKLTASSGLPTNNAVFNYEVNAGQQLCFTVTAKDSNVSPISTGVDTTYISWDSSLVRPGKLTFGPTYTVGVGPRPREDQWQFCWQTDSLDGRDLPYTFTVTAIDKSCPSVGKTTQSFSILAKQTPSFSSSKTIMPCRRVVYNLFKNKPNTAINTALFQITTSPNDRSFSNGTRNISAIITNPNTAPGDTLNQPRLMLADTFNYLLPGKYYTRLYYTTSTQNFLAPFIDSIEVANNLTIGFINANGPTSICNGDSVVLAPIYSQPNFKYQWLLNNVNITNATQSTLKVKVAGSYSVKVTDTTLNCINFSNPITVQVNPNPVANFYSPSMCTKVIKAQAFIDISTIPSGNTKRTWQFGTSISNLDTAIAINKVFNSVEAVDVKLVSISNFGCKDSITRTYYVDPAFYMPSREPNESCENDTTILTISSPLHFRYLWLKNNDTIPAAISSRYAATTSGMYVVIGTNTYNNCVDTMGIFNLALNPKPKPAALLSSNNICINNSNLTFTDSSTIKSGSYTRLWSFGDGTTATTITGNKQYNNVGSYTLKLLLTSNKNCKDSLVRTVDVNNPPVANISANSNTVFCEGNAVQLSSIYYPNATYYWYRNNQLISNADTSNLNVTLSGSYKLIIDNGGVCRDTSNIITVQVYPTPKVGFTVNNDTQCLNNNQFLVTDTSLISSGNYSRTWTWGNNTSSQPSLSINFANAGNQQVQLKATSNMGCSDSIAKTLMVIAQPNLGPIAGPSIGLDTQQVYDYEVNQQLNHTYNWTVTNGNITTGQGTKTIKVQWLTAGIGKIKATITNANNCSKSDSITVSINTAPSIISFTPQTGTNGTVVTINGGNFINVSAVTFGGVNAKSFNVVSNTVVSAIVDTGATGSVSVVTPSGTALLNTFTYTSNTGVTEIGTQSFSVFPNPVTSEIVVESNQPLNQTTFELIDANGKIVISKTCNNAISKYTIDVKELNPAIYLLRITSQGQSNTVKIIKQ